MKVGDRITAEVTAVRDNGIFVTHDGREGLIRVVELTWDETRKPIPADFACVGGAVELHVTSVHEAGFSGSLKMLSPATNPRLHPALTDGRVLVAHVRAILSWGVLVNLPIGLVARLDPCPEATRATLHVDMPVEVVVTAVDGDSGKITARLSTP